MDDKLWLNGARSITKHHTTTGSSVRSTIRRTTTIKKTNTNSSSSALIQMESKFITEEEKKAVQKAISDLKFKINVSIDEVRDSQKRRKIRDYSFIFENISFIAFWTELVQKKPKHEYKITVPDKKLCLEFLQAFFFQCYNSKYGEFIEKISFKVIVEKTDIEFFVDENFLICSFQNNSIRKLTSLPFNFLQHTHQNSLNYSAEIYKFKMLKIPYIPINIINDRDKNDKFDILEKQLSERKMLLETLDIGFTLIGENEILRPEDLELSVSLLTTYVKNAAIRLFNGVQTLKNLFIDVIFDTSFDIGRIVEFNKLSKYFSFLNKEGKNLTIRFSSLKKRGECLRYVDKIFPDHTLTSLRLVNLSKSSPLFKLNQKVLGRVYSFLPISQSVCKNDFPIVYSINNLY